MKFKCNATLRDVGQRLTNNRDRHRPVLVKIAERSGVIGATASTKKKRVAGPVVGRSPGTGAW